MDPGTLQQMAHDPSVYLASVVIPGGRGPARLADAAADFQREDFAALAPSFLALAEGRAPPRSRFWIECTKGASKDTDCAVMLLWLLAFSRRPLCVQVGAADLDQAAELRKAAESVLRLNPWLRPAVEIQALKLVGVKTGVVADVIPADVAGSHGRGRTCLS